jgi:DNA uptake protein ComE-like DNA-binding protein
LRASNNRLAGLEAEMAIAGAARYASNILAQLDEPGLVPELDSYGHEAMPVGSAYFWFIGRTPPDQTVNPDQISFSLIDEASKLNLNTATREMLEELPGMTAELAAAIIDWRDEDSEVTSGGAEDETYLRLNPPYRCKNADFESVGELRLVLGAHLDILFGEDTNMNGILDPNENDGDLSPPLDNRNGRLDGGILEFVTVHSRQSNLKEDGSTKVNVTDNNRQPLRDLLMESFGEQRATEVMARLNGPPGTLNSLLAFYARSGLTEDEFTRIEGDLSTSNDPSVPGLVNVNTAPEEVLIAIPGIGTDHASSLIAQRRSNPDSLTTLAWVTEVLNPEDAQRAGPFLTGRSHQFTADIAAVGRHGRGYRRVRFVFDTSETTPKIIFRQDLSLMGWALGWSTRQLLQEAQRLL